MVKNIFVLMAGDKYSVDNYVVCAFGSTKALSEYIEENRKKGILTGFEPDKKDAFSERHGLSFSSSGALWFEDGLDEDAWIDVVTYRE